MQSDWRVKRRGLKIILRSSLLSAVSLGLCVYLGWLRMEQYEIQKLFLGPTRYYAKGLGRDKAMETFSFLQEYDLRRQLSFD